METMEDLESVNKKTQEMIGRHYYGIRRYRKLQYNTENLLARLDTDTELIACKYDLIGLIFDHRQKEEMIYV